MATYTCSFQGMASAKIYCNALFNCGSPNLITNSIAKSAKSYSLLSSGAQHADWHIGSSQKHIILLCDVALQCVTTCE